MNRVYVFFTQNTKVNGTHTTRCVQVCTISSRVGGPHRKRRDEPHFGTWSQEIRSEDSEHFRVQRDHFEHTTIMQRICVCPMRGTMIARSTSALPPNLRLQWDSHGTSWGRPALFFGFRGMPTLGDDPACRHMTYRRNVLHDTPVNMQTPFPVQCVLVVTIFLSWN